MIQWGLSQGNGFDNALNMGLQFGQQIRQRREQETQRNALAAYAKSPGEDTLGGVIEADPRLGLALRSDMVARQTAQEQKRQQDAGVLRQLLTKAGESPEGWAQAIGAAQQMGLDLSQVPQQYNPAWAKQQLFIADALEKERDNIPGIAREVMFGLGIEDPSDPRVQQGVLAVINGKYSSDYVDEQGNTRRRSTLNLGGQEAPANVPQIADEAGYNALPPGTQYRDPQGNLRVKGGTAGNGGGNFQ